MLLNLLLIKDCQGIQSKRGLPRPYLRTAAERGFILHLQAGLMISVSTSNGHGLIERLSFDGDPCRMDEISSLRL